MVREAIKAVEEDGIVFIDEIDKIVSPSDYRYGMLLPYMPQLENGQYVISCESVARYC